MKESPGYVGVKLDINLSMAAIAKLMSNFNRTPAMQALVVVGMYKR